MAVNSGGRCVGAASLCLNVVLLVVIFDELRVVRHQPAVVTPPAERGSTRTTTARYRTSSETAFAMYGGGNYSDVDPQLLDYIRSMVSVHDPAVPRTLSGNFQQTDASRHIDELLKGRRGGFYVECGAFFGDEYSHSVYFELNRDWSGLLIEANPAFHRALLAKNRRAFVLRACLSATRKPGLEKFTLDWWGSGISTLNRNVPVNKTADRTDVQCFSLNSVMSALGRTHIDYMSLDVEGAEIPILETIDWSRLTVDVFGIEYLHADRLGKLRQLREFFNRTTPVVRYREVGKVPRGASDAGGHDVIFMRQALL